MKKNRNLIILVILLGSLSTYLMTRNTNSSVKKELEDFAIADTASITKIFLADRNGHTILLQKKTADQWSLNDSLAPRMDAFHHLMEAITRMRVKNRIPKSGYNNVIKNLASGGIKCEIYLNNETEPAKVYYVGGETQDDLGTYMMIENSSVPFIMEIPGFNGYLTPRYSTNLESWKVPMVFTYEPDSIRMVTVTYPAFPEKSFVLEHNSGVNRISNPQSGKQVLKIDSVAVDNYLSLFRGLFYEGIDNSMNASEHDSLRTTEALSEISVTDRSGKKNTVIIYPMPVNDASLLLEDSLGQPLRYDVDRMIAFLTSGNTWVLIQHYTFDKLFRQTSDFDLERNKPKILGH